MRMAYTYRYSVLCDARDMVLSPSVINLIGFIESAHLSFYHILILLLLPTCKKGISNLLLLNYNYIYLNLY